jgi:hypothetical protein
MIDPMSDKPSFRNAAAPFATAVLFLLITLVSGCKQPETITAQQSDDQMAADTTQQTTTTSEQEDAVFRQLNVGELEPIHTLDPLMAENSAELRMVQLLFEGLTHLDAQGTVKPALAKKWEVNSDSTQFTFNLRTDIYYHDSPVFPNGTGRRFLARDVAFVFLRMAERTVPSTAASLFEDIEGFQPYIQEKHELYLQSKRQISRIDGIRLPNDSTVVFNLVKPDADFLKKLATPYAAIYPNENVDYWNAIAGGEALQRIQTAGTGPFQYNRYQPSDSTWVLEEFRSYNTTDQDIQLDRIDIRTYNDERNTFDALLEQSIHLIPEVGPLTMDTITGGTDSITNSYDKTYRLSFNPSSHYRHLYLMHNPSDRSWPASKARGALDRIDTSLVYTNAHSNIELYPAADRSASMNSTPTAFQDTMSVIYSAYTTDTFGREVYRYLQERIDMMDGMSFHMNNVYIPIPTTTYWTHRVNPIMTTFGNPEVPTQNVLLKMDIQPVSALHKSLQGFNRGVYTWWFDLRSTTLNPSLNQSL